MNAPAPILASPHITYFPDLIQGSEEWLAARCGLLTASEMKLILTPTLKVAANDKTRAHVYELLAQRISRYVEPSYIGPDMVRGHEDEMWARVEYEKHIARVHDMGFIVNRKWGFPIGYSPDGMVGDDGLIECKSRKQAFQVRTVTDHVADQTIPEEFLLQCQTGLLVSERQWLDFISYSGGLPMVVIRVYPDERVQQAIIDAAADFEDRVAEKLRTWTSALNSDARLIPTERRIQQEMFA